jgi:hypothetical protein
MGLYSKSGYGSEYAGPWEWLAFHWYSSFGYSAKTPATWKNPKYLQNRTERTLEYLYRAIELITRKIHWRTFRSHPRWRNGRWKSLT